VSKVNISIFIALLSNVVQHCEYALFGLSGTIIAKAFFPKSEMIDKLIWFYAVLYISVFFKPLGSYIFGKIGDIYGRSKAFQIGMIVSGISTFFVGVIPSFEELGYLSVLLLISCRILLIMTGHIDNITIYVTESVEKKYANFASGLICISTQTGIFIASLIFYIANYYEQEYLWRLNFIISGLLGLLILFLRKMITETKEFENNRKDNTETSPTTDSIFSLIRKQKSNFIRAAIIHGSIGGIYNFYILFFSNYVSHLIQIANSNGPNLAVNIGIGICALLAPLAGLLADKIGGPIQILYFLLLNIVLVIINIIFIYAGNYSFIMHVVLIAIYPFFMVPIIVYLKGIFNVNIRMRLYGLSHTVGSTILSSSTPLICSILSKFTNIGPLIFLLFLNILLIIFCPKKETIVNHIELGGTKKISRAFSN
jgi:MHS family proline/betaine transporter-like MFS transporter